MKKLLWLLSVYVIQLSSVIPPQECFLQGNKYFFDGKFEQARSCFEQIPHRNSSIWQNIGNCYYNENNHAKALVCWKRAQRGAHYNQLEQLFESERLVLQKFDCPCDGIFIRTIKKIILAMPKLLLYGVLILLFILFITLFYQCVMQKRKSYKSVPCKKSYLFSLVLAIIVFLLLIAAKEKFTKEKQGVLMHQKVVVHAGPETTFHQKMTLPQGYLVDVLDEDKNMYKICCPKVSGWIAADTIELV